MKDAARVVEDPVLFRTGAVAVHYGRGVAFADAVAIGRVRCKENYNDKEKSFY